MASDSTRVDLAVPIEQAEDILANAIRRGDLLRAQSQSVQSEESFKELTRDAVSWRKFVIAALQRISVGDSLESEFSKVGRTSRVRYIGEPTPMLDERLETFQDTHASRLAMLHSVVERLPLFIPATQDVPAKELRKPMDSSRVFVVHGRQKTLAENVARFVERLGFKATILDEQANKGRTLIEKFEASAEPAGFAVVMMLADDRGVGPDDGTEWPSAPNRARQNVILELGYFVGRLGRERVVALMEADLEKPSDLHGIAYVPFDDNWRMGLLREMKAVFPSLDTNQAFE